MKSKPTILVVTGTRAEYGLLAPVIALLKKNKALNIKILVTGLHVLKKYGHTLREVEKQVSVDAVVPIAEKDSMLTALAKEISGIEAYVVKNTINYIVVLGDRDEPLAAAMVGVHLGIPIIHISGGDVSGPSVDNYLRNTITACSQLHLVQTKESQKNVLRMIGKKNNQHVQVVGSVGLDGIKNNLFSRQKIADILGLNSKEDWVLVSFHPTPLDSVSFSKQINSVTHALSKLSENCQKIVLYPNNDTGTDIFIAEIEKFKNKNNFLIKPHLERNLFLSLLSQSMVLIGNSSAGLIEAAFLKVPYVLVGNRQAGREFGPNTVKVPYYAEEILKAVALVQTKAFTLKLKKSRSPYTGGGVAKKIALSIEKFVTSYES